MICKNNFDDVLLDNYQKICFLDVFFGKNGKKNICLPKGSSVKYVFVIKNSNIDLFFDLAEDFVELDLFGIFVGNVKSSVVASISANNVFVDFHIFGLVKKDAEMFIDGKISIENGVEKIEGHLIEEQILLGTPKSLFVRPVLDVRSNEIKASHGAKIHNLDSQKLFYMMSRGLSKKDAQGLVIKSSIEFAFEKLTDIDPVEKQSVLDQILSSVF